MVDLAPGPEAIVDDPILVYVSNQLFTENVTHRSLICLDMVKKACSTLVAFLAEVSRKGIPSSSAKDLASAYSTTFLVAKSDLLPTKSLLTPSTAYRSISCNHCLTLV